MTHTPHAEEPTTLRWRAHDWKRLLVHMIGSADQELLLRRAYVVTENHLLRQQIREVRPHVMPPRLGGLLTYFSPEAA